MIDTYRAGIPGNGKPFPEAISGYQGMGSDDWSVVSSLDVTVITEQIRAQATLVASSPRLNHE